MSAVLDVTADGGVAACEARVDLALEKLMQLSQALQALQMYNILFCAPFAGEIYSLYLRNVSRIHTLSIDRQDARFVEAAVHEALKVSNEVTLSSTDDSDGTVERLRYLLLRSAGQRANMDFDFVTGTVVSSSMLVRK